MTCPNCSRLRDEMADAILKRRFRLTPAESKLLAGLLHEDLTGIGPRDCNVTGVRIHRIRQVIGRDAVETLTHGYRLTPNGRRIVAGAVHGEEVAA